MERTWSVVVRPLAPNHSCRSVVLFVFARPAAAAPPMACGGARQPMVAKGTCIRALL